MPKQPDFFKIITGKTFKETYRLETLQGVVDLKIKQDQTSYPLRLLGNTATDGIYISEEERSANFHILGAPGEGKSKFLEYHIRKDIDMGNGLCLLDPSEKGDTVQNVLRYCAKVGHEKVILIDPTQDRLAKIATLNPKSVKRSVAGVMEALSILFETRATNTPRIKRYLSALLRILTRQNLTLTDAKYFSDYHRDRQQRSEILENDRDSATIKNLFRSEYRFDTFFSSSVNQLDALWQQPLLSMLANKEGINFIQAVSEGWVILVNLSPYQLTEEESKLLGILVISQIIQAVDVLVNSNWKKVFYLYIDEAGRFATPQIDTLLSYKRKSGLRLVLAHHFNDQFEDKKVFNSIANNARIKLMFDTPNPDDRHFAMKAMGYGGDITPVMAAFANQNLPKQNAILKKNKETPVRIRIPDVSTIDIDIKPFIEKITSSNWYDTRPPKPDPASPLNRTAPNQPTTRTAPLSRRPAGESVRESEEATNPPPKRKPLKF